MKRPITTILVLLALLVGYWAWPFFELRALAGAVQAGDVTAINEKIILAFAVLLPSRLSALICALQVGLRLAR